VILIIEESVIQAMSDWGRARRKIPARRDLKSDDDPRGQNGSHILAPHFAGTLSNLNYSTTEPLADHSPITVDLPFH
jgi:hypothetical protein